MELTIHLSWWHKAHFLVFNVVCNKLVTFNCTLLDTFDLLPVSYLMVNCFCANHLFKLKHNCSLVRGRICQIRAFIKLEIENADKNLVGLKHNPMDSKMSPSTSEVLLPGEALTAALAALELHWQSFPVLSLQ